MSGIGLDLGHRSIRWVRLARSRDGSIRLERAILADAPAPGEGEEGADPTRAEAVSQLRRELAAAREKARPVRLGLGAGSYIVQYAHVPVVPSWRLELIMGYEIEEVQTRVAEPITADYRLVSASDAGRDQLLVMVAFVKDAQVEPRIDRLEGHGFGVRGVSPSSIALYNALRGLHLAEEGQTGVLVDVGHAETQIAIHRDGFLVFARGAQQGVGPIVERLASDLDCPEEEALRVATEGPSRADEATFRRAVEPAFERITGVIQSSFRVGRAQTKLKSLDVDEVWIAGGGARIEGLPEHVADRLGVPARVFDPLEHCDLSGLSASERALIEGEGPRLAVACGLALMEEAPDAFDVDVLPTRFQERRRFRRRTLFLWLAAGVLGLFLLFSLAQAWMRHGEVAARNEELSGRVATLEDRHRALQELHEQNLVRRGVLENLSDRAEPGHALALLLDRLRGVLPEGAALREIRFDGAAGATGESAEGGEAPSGEAVGGVPLVLSGEVDHAAGEGHALIRSLEERLRAIPSVTSARIDPGSLVEDRGESFIRFVIEVVVGRASPSGER